VAQALDIERQLGARLNLVEDLGDPRDVQEGREADPAQGFRVQLVTVLEAEMPA